MKASAALVLAFLKVRGADGASEAEIQAATAIRSGAQRVHELRACGYRIETVYERSPIGARYARFVLTEVPDTLTPTTGTQRELFA